MSKLETNTIDNISGSSTLTIGDSNASTISIPKNITLGASGTTITVPSGATITNNGTQSGFGGTNTPAFEATLTSSQVPSQATSTKVQVNTEIFDTDNCYDNSTNYRFTPNVAGKYFVYGRLRLQSTSDSELRDTQTFIYKNGSVVADSAFLFRNNHIRSSTHTITSIIDMNGSTDYVELWGYINVNSGSIDGFINNNYRTIFGAYKIIE